MWRDNKANGHGKFYHADGDVYDGEWVDDRANGAGTYYYGDRRGKYVGGWKDDMQDGQGRETWQDGSTYVG